MASAQAIKKRILLVDDAEDIGILLKTVLTSHQVDQAQSIQEAQAVLSQFHYDLFLIDVTLGDGNGFDFCTDLNANPEYAQIPKIILSGKSQVAEKVYGFTCGADDYITKPFHTIEFKARVERQLARGLAPIDNVLIHSDLEIDIEFQKCSLIGDNGKIEMNLTQTEFRLLLTLLKNRGRVLSREQLEKAVWQSFGSSIERRGIDTHISHLRKKLGPLKSRLASVYGQGYTFKKAA